ncbi:MAG: hypothetical protein ACRDVM_04695, partial [Acidimicrobiia bacterium]
MNPVLLREVKERFRSRRAEWFITLWVLVVGVLAYLIYLLAQLAAREGFGMVGLLGREGFGMGRLVATGFIGQFMFELVTLLMVTAVVMVVPGLTASAIVGERERQTLHLLQVTQLTPLRLVWGKLASSLSYFLLLLVAVAPVMAVPLLFGGITFGDVAGAVGMLLATATVLG